MNKPIVMVSSYPPRLCGIATFCEEAREFIEKANPDRQVYVVSHTDGEGPGVFPVIDMTRKDWYQAAAEKILSLDPYVVHIEHEYGLYNYFDQDKVSDNNDGFLKLLDLLKDVPTVIEPHTVHGRLMPKEEKFIKQITKKGTIVFFKCNYQKWRLEWIFTSRNWRMPKNIMIIPHGARPDKRFSMEEIEAIKKDLGMPFLQGKHIVGLVGWVQNNKRWDIVSNMWEEVHDKIKAVTGEDWYLLAAGDMRDPYHKKDYDHYIAQIQILAEKNIAHYFKFIPRGDLYYKVMAICDFIVLPSIDETQSGTLARIISLNKPYITSAPLEGLTSQTLESGGGLLFTTKEMLKKKMLRLALDEGLRWHFGYHLYNYLRKVVSWEVVAHQYNQAYELADKAKHEKYKIDFPNEF
ncbi:MAG: hypothetical protein PHF84_09090 [bacterium]|nr:hypothetical protein [bacterium]